MSLSALDQVKSCREQPWMILHVNESNDLRCVLIFLPNNPPSDHITCWSHQEHTNLGGGADEYQTPTFCRSHWQFFWLACSNSHNGFLHVCTYCA